MSEVLKHFVCSVLKTRPRESAARLGDIVGMETGEKFLHLSTMTKSINDFWVSALPPDFLEHLRLAGLKDGILLIEIDSPSYGYELFLRSHELLQQMRQLHFPVKKIRFIFGDQFNV